MFVEAVDRASLRQGDILKGIRFPKLTFQDEKVLSIIAADAEYHSQIPGVTVLTHAQRGDALWLTGQIPLRISFCLVISQCCDLELRNGKFLMPAFALARLIPIPPAISSDPQKLASLKANKDPRDPNDPGYRNYFFIQTHELLDNKEWIVDYNQTLCIPGSEFANALSRKILQMDDRTRVKFKFKLVASFGRLTDDERTAGLENPWMTRNGGIVAAHAPDQQA